MRKLSNVAGKIKSLDDQKFELSRNVNELLESKKEPRVIVHSLARQAIKARIDVLEANGIKEYEFKSNIISEIEDPSYVFDHDKSFDSFKKKVLELLAIFPPDKRQTVNTYLNNNQEYIPAEIKSLMLATGKIDVSDCEKSMVEQSIKMYVDHFYELEFLFINMCAKTFPNSDEADKIKNCYFPRIKWQGSISEFAELMSTLKRNNWIDIGSASTVRQFSNLCNFHFSLIDNKRNEAKYDAVKKAFDLQQKRIVVASKKELEQLQHEFKFDPLAIPVNVLKS